MKKITTGLLLTSLILNIQIVIAQDYPAAEQHWQNQHHLLKNGRATGKSSKQNASRLRVDYKQVQKKEKRMRQHSWLSAKPNEHKYLKSDPPWIRAGKRNMHFLKRG
jgi:hypothetical protein